MNTLLLFKFFPEVSEVIVVVPVTPIVYENFVLVRQRFHSIVSL